MRRSSLTTRTEAGAPRQEDPEGPPPADPSIGGLPALRAGVQDAGTPEWQPRGSSEGTLAQAITCDGPAHRDVGGKMSSALWSHTVILQMVPALYPLEKPQLLCSSHFLTILGIGGAKPDPFEHLQGLQGQISDIAGVGGLSSLGGGGGRRYSSGSTPPRPKKGGSIHGPRNPTETDPWARR